MKKPQNEREWEELFRKVLPDVPVPTNASRNARTKLRHELLAARNVPGQRTSSGSGAVNGADMDADVRARGSAMPQWLRHLKAMPDYVGRSSVWVWFTVVAAFAIMVITIIAGLPVQEADAVTIRIDAGSALIRRASTGQTSVVKADETSYLEPGDELAGNTGVAIISCFDGQTTRVLPGAHVQLVSYRQQGAGRQVQLAVTQGRMVVEVNANHGADNRIEVVSPSSVAAVDTSGTTQAAITVDVRSDKQTSYQADVGVASVTMGSRTVAVRPGQQVLATVGKGLAIATPVQVAEVPGAVVNVNTSNKTTQRQTMQVVARASAAGPSEAPPATPSDSVASATPVAPITTQAAPTVTPQPPTTTPVPTSSDTEPAVAGAPTIAPAVTVPASPPSTLSSPILAAPTDTVTPAAPTVQPTDASEDTPQPKPELKPKPTARSTTTPTMATTNPVTPELGVTTTVIPNLAPTPTPILTAESTFVPVVAITHTPPPDPTVAPTAAALQTPFPGSNPEPNPSSSPGQEPNSDSRYHPNLNEVPGIHVTALTDGRPVGLPRGRGNGGPIGSPVSPVRPDVVTANATVDQ